MAEHPIGEWSIDCSFPGGNVRVDGATGSHVWLSPDQRDSQGRWFYWCFRVRAASGSQMAVTLPAAELIGARGPAFSLDGGCTWAWMGRGCVDGATFHFAIPTWSTEARFAATIPYTQANLAQFTGASSGRDLWQRTVLCRTRRGRVVEALRMSSMGEGAPLALLVTARHHACETLASYALEGLLSGILAEDEIGGWLRKNLDILVIPFVDKDGVEQGDQGKNRMPHDHNRDYFDGLYPEVRAIRSLVPRWSAGRPLVALDLHCPWLGGERNERVYFVGGPDPGQWREVKALSTCLEAGQAPVGGLRFATADNMAFGEDWNNGFDLEMKSFSGWASRLPGIRLSSVVEIPYASANGQEVNPHSARVFGHDLAGALAAYLSG
jgi:hypothetical protein